MTTEKNVNDYGQAFDAQCTFKQVNRLKWILAEYFMAEQEISRTPQNKKLFEIRLYASVKNLHNVPEKARPTVAVVQKYFDAYGMAKNANGIWERTNKTKLPAELTALVQIDNPEEAAIKASLEAPVKKAAKKKTIKKKAVKATARKAKPTDIAPNAAVAYTDLSPEARKQIAAMRADGFTMAEAREFLAL